MKKNIAVVGGGTTALYLLHAFVAKGQPNTTLDIFEASKNVGMGMPYNSQWANLEHRINIASKELPKALEEPHDWLHRQSDALLKEYGIKREEITPDLIFPRILFGKYHESQFFSLLEKACRKGLTVSVHTECKITRIEKIDEKNLVRLTTDKGSEIEFTSVIIATGHEWSIKKETIAQGYYDSPFPLRKLNRVLNHPVGLLGSSLSAVDAIRTLARAHGSFQYKNGKLKYMPNKGIDEFSIVMHSRRGLLPAIRYRLEHPRIRKYEYISKSEIMENIKSNNGYLSLDYVFEKSYKNTIKKKDPQIYNSIKDMRLEEFSDFYYRRAGINNLNPFLHFKDQLKISEDSERNMQPIYWKEAIEDTYYTLNFHAKSLCAEDMNRLRKYFMPLYNHVIIFMPFDSAYELVALHEAGKLDIVATGNNSDITIKNNRPGAVIRYNDQKGEFRNVYYKIFIDCRGQKDLSIADFPFRELVKQKVVAPARIKFSSNKERLKVRQNLASGCSIKKYGESYYLQLPGIAINDNFKAINELGKSHNKIYILANPYIKGFNPDLSGIPSCKDSADMVIHAIVGNN